MAGVPAQPERAHVHEKTDCALRAGAGAMILFYLMQLRTRIAMKKFFLTILRPRMVYPYVSEIYE